MVGAAVLLAAIGWIFPWVWPEPAALGLVAVCVVAALAWSALQRLPDPVVARAIDRSLQTDDALIAALQFAPTEPYGPEIHARAQTFADEDVKAAMPIRWRRRRLLVIGVLAGLLVAAVLIRNPQDSAREQAAAEQAQIDELSDVLEERAETVRDSGIDGADALADELAAAADSLRDADNAEEAAAALDQAQQDLLRGLDADELAQRGAVVGLQRALDSQPFPGSAAVAGAEGTGSVSAQLGSLAGSLAEISEQEQGELATRLGALAETQTVGDPETAEALADAAIAQAEGDLEAAEEALRAAGDTAQAAADAAAETAAIAQAAAEAAEAADEFRNSRVPTEGAPDRETTANEGGRRETGGNEDAGGGTASIGVTQAGRTPSGVASGRDAAPGEAGAQDFAGEETEEGAEETGGAGGAVSEEGDGGAPSGEGQGTGIGDGLENDGAPGAGGGGLDDLSILAESDLDLDDVEGFDRLEIDSVGDGQGSGQLTPNSPTAGPTGAGTGGVVTDADLQSLRDSLGGISSDPEQLPFVISGSEANTISEYFNQLIEEN